MPPLRHRLARWRPRPVALRLQRDLGLNLAGAALALELLDEVEALRERLRILGET